MAFIEDEGVWVVIGSGFKVTEIYKTEIEALRVINADGCGRVKFVEWGEVK